MKKLMFVIIAAVVVSAFSQNKSIGYVLSKYTESTSNISRIEYNIQRIDTFLSNNAVWNNKGYALIEKQKEDKLFGFCFFGDRFDIDEQFIYDGKNEIRINKNKKSYKISKPGMGFLGSPGGQMVAKELLFPDTIYESVKLLNDKENLFIIEYKFADDTVYDVLNRIKIIELSKDNFLPLKVTSSYSSLGKKGVYQAIITNLKINSNVSNSIDNIKSKLVDYKLVEEKIEPLKNLINKEAFAFNLPRLFDESVKTGLPKGKLILLDFWEVWCSPCIASLPKVEKIAQKFSDKISVLGIVSDDIESTKRFLKKRDINFTNLIGNKDLIEKYGVNSYPRYFLIDKTNVIIGEYYGYNKQIEEDIINYLSSN